MQLTSLLRGYRRHRSLVVNYVILCVVLIFTLYPLFVVFVNALKTTAETYTNPLGFPHTLQFDNFLKVWVEAKFSKAIPNSLFAATATAIVVVVLASLAGYSLARLKPRGGDAVTLYFLAGGSLPAQMFLVPLFFLWRKMHLVDSLAGLILIYIGTMAPFMAYLLRAFFISLPPDFEDAAKVDGASQLQILRFVMLPLAKPGFLTVFLLTWQNVWNEFFFANIFINSEKLQTVALRYVVWSWQYFTDWAMTNAMGVMMIIPVLILFLITQESFIKGLTQGGLKF